MKEIEALKMLEGLAERKAAVYGRVLTDVTLATEMQDLAQFHVERVAALASLLGEDVPQENGDEA